MHIFGKIASVLFCLLILAALVSIGKLYEVNGANSILVIQAPVSGKLTVYTTPGTKWQGWGKVTHYTKSSWINFNPKERGVPIKVRFADGGHGDVFGSARYDLPLDAPHIIDLHTTFGGQDALEKQLIRTTAERSMYMTGPMMTSSESFNVRRQDLINLFEDQAVNGVFKTEQTSKEIEDPITNEKKWITMVDLKKDKDGTVERQEVSPFIRFAIKFYNVSVVDIDYDDVVKNQIAKQQEAKMAVQIAIANSQRAQQDALTAEQTGRAAATTAKWEQEKIKAQKVTEAGQEKEVAETAAKKRLAVATLDRQAAEQTKQQQILLGEGESTRQKLIMSANGALEQKLATYKEVMGNIAAAIGQYKGNLVPQVVMAGGASGAGANGTPNNVAQLMDMFGVKVARDLALDTSMTTNALQRTAAVNNNP